MTVEDTNSLKAPLVSSICKNVASKIHTLLFRLVRKYLFSESFEDSEIGFLLHWFLPQHFSYFSDLMK